MEYIIGQSYDMKVSQVVVENFPTSLQYVLAENNQRVRVYDFEKNRCSKVKSIKCIYRGLDDSGAKRFYRDRLFLMKDLFSPGHIYEFAYRSAKKDGDNILYYNVRDKFGMQHAYQGPLTEKQRKKDAKIWLYLKGIDETNARLQLEEASVSWDSNKNQETMDEDLDSLFNDYIKYGGDTVLKAIANHVKADLKVEMWGSIYRMAQKLHPDPKTLMDIRSEIVASYKNVLLQNAVCYESPLLQTATTAKLTKLQKQIAELYDEDKTITEMMEVCSLSRYDIVKQLIESGIFYTSQS